MSTGTNDGAVIRDSAIIITGATVLLFVWGYAFEAFRWTGATIPGVFQPEVAVQERALVGGILALFVFLPLALLVWAVDIMAGRRLGRWLARTWRSGPVSQAVVALVLFAASIAIVRPVSAILDRFGGRLEVESVTLKSGSPTIHKGMYCIGKRGSTYVFVDGAGTQSPQIHLVAEDNVASMVLTYRRWR